MGMVPGGDWRRGGALLGAALSVAVLGACGGSPDPGPATQVRMDFARPGGFYDTPFPGVDRQALDGRLDLTGFPNPANIPFINEVVALGAAGVDGASLNAGVFFALTGALDPASLPDLEGTTTAESPIWLLDVDPASPALGRRLPFSVDFRVEGGPHGAPNLLTVLPVQGVPLRPGTRYAVALGRGLRDAEGRPLGVPPALRALARGDVPAGLAPATATVFHEALAALEVEGLAAEDLVGLAVFRTADPTAEFLRAVGFARAEHLPAPPTALTLTEVYDDYCVLHGTVDMTTYQAGEPPYTNRGGSWVVDAEGRPAVQGTERANLWVTLPRRPVPAAGLPAVVFIRTGGGGDRPLVDRGRHAEPHGEAVEPGEGPARYLARAGFAGVSVDGPHGGLRNASGGDEQLLMFNFLNPEALKDNIRQSALEIALLPDVLAAMTLDASGCPGVTGDATDAIGFDLDTLALMGHSMGATIAPLAAAAEPRYRALVLSGAGGSWLENVIHKQSPLDVRAVAELLLQYDDVSLHRHDPAVSLVQWAADPADPLCYLRALVTEPGAAAPRHVLMFQGIVDTYILPPIANAYSLGLGLDLAGPALDAGHPELVAFQPLGALLALTGRGARDLPLAGNREGASPGAPPVTAVVVQHGEDDIEDGHEVMFQLELPKAQYECFLRTLRAGTPYVPAEAGDPACQ